MADELFESLMKTTIVEEKPEENAEMAPTNETAQQSAAEEKPAETPSAETVPEPPKEERTNNESQQEAPKGVDYNEWLKTQSEGLFENAETFKSSLTKFKEYDTLSGKVTQLEKNQLPDDPFVKKLAEMRGNGASKDQISEFIKLNNEYEDFSSLTPQQVKVAKLVLVDGYSKETAERKVARDFDVSGFEEGSEDFVDIQEELRISSKVDLQELEKYKATLTTTENSAEAQRLEQIALKSAHEINVKQTIPNLLDKVSAIGEIEFSGKVGKEDIASKMNFDYDDEFKKVIPEMLETFFTQEIEPITPEKIQEASNYIKSVYLLNNFEKISKDIFLSALAIANEKTENKYINPKNIEETTKDAPDQNANLQAEWKAFEERFAQNR